RKGSLTLTLPDKSTRQFGNLDEPPSARVIVHDESFFKDLALEEDIGLGESYEAGKWDTVDLTGFIQWLLINKEYFSENRSNWIQNLLRRLLLGFERVRHYRRRNSIEQSRKNIQFHYDLGNSFYKTFLDASMTYSSAFFSGDDLDLEAGQIEKYDRICRKLNLQPGMHILEIGTGWGGFACHAAKKYQVHVTTTTLSDRQYELAHEKIYSAGLEGQIRLLKQDYRDLTGNYDRIVSIEMMEAVGHRYLQDYFASCYRLLKPDGLAAYQVILSANSQYNSYRKGVDWIRKHIFPGGHLPSLNAVTSALEEANIPWDLYHLETFGLHYAKTLREWQNAYNQNLQKLQELGVTESFNRKWNFYLSYCEAGFLQRHVNVAQFVFGQPDIVSYCFENQAESTRAETENRENKTRIA
ncbi:MAG: cyclopropane-fatty-acyl-phospholipid synthase family protein, partial [Verrucomicrobiae bacterium]|nr:cyclopropane-fatty-acyl-phospholipid synthase family protein [Verrucomicrobiae bacterium]